MLHRSAVVFAALLALPRPSVAQTTLDPFDTWERQAQHWMYQHRVEQNLDDQTHRMGIGSLDEGKSTSFLFTAQGPGSYRVLAVCDNDCTDIDLYLYGMDGSLLDSDVELDDFPWVDTEELKTGASRQYRVEVGMPSCSANPCRFALSVFAR